MSEQTAVRLVKGRDGWKAESMVDFDGEQKLTVSTYKGGKGVLTIASVAKHVDGMMSFEICGDYLKRVMNVEARATEKNVMAQQQQVLGVLSTLLDDARTFYKIKAARLS